MTRRILSIDSPRGLAWKLGIKLHHLKTLAGSSPKLYHPFTEIIKGRPRLIDNPEERLKRAQRRIHDILLAPLLVEEHLHGSVKGRSPLTNATIHLNKRIVVRIDIRDFFPFISHRRVYYLFRDELRCSPPVAGLLTQITTYRGHLPQGSPASSDLANLILYETDQRILDACTEKAVTFTRTIDDHVLSGDKPQVLIQFVVTELRKAGFKVSRRKLAIQPNWENQCVTGYTVNRALGIPRQKTDAVRAAIYQLTCEPETERLKERAIRSLRGRIGHIGSASPGEARRLEMMLNRRLVSLRPAEIST